MTRMKNYRDLSTNSAGSLSAGFQFEFYCQCCEFTWTSAYKPHRIGQISAWLSRLATLAGDLSKAGRATGIFADAGSRAAHEKAFEAAHAQAERYFLHCQGCDKQVCEDCMDEAHGLCKGCVKQKSGARGQAGYGSGEYGEETTHRCPNCQAPSNGGRFCHECGFDTASTHKGCPACGSVMPRAARFCTDCGHGF